MLSLTLGDHHAQVTFTLPGIILYTFIFLLILFIFTE